MPDDFNELGGTANAGAIRASIDFDANGLERAVNRAMTKATAIIGAKVDEASTEMQEKVEGGFRGLGHRIIGFLGVEDISYAINRAAHFIINIGRETEQSLNTFQAVSSATKAQMKSVSDLAIQLGNDMSLPATSAAGAATAMTELAKSGFDVEQSMAAAKGALQLAAAAQTDAGTAAEITADQINAFNLKASDASMVADLLANASNESAADIQGIADSLQQAGAVANAAGLSITDTASAIALMANNSIQGSDAGTSLKTMLVSLAAPSTKAQGLMDKYGISVYDTQGRLKDLAGITASLTKGTKGLTDQQKQYVLATIFGTDAIRAVNVLMKQGADGLNKMNANLTKEGAAAKLAAANTKGLTGALSALQGNAESLAIEFYQHVSPALDKFIRGGLEKLPGFLDETSQYLGQVTDDLEPAADLIRQFVEAASPGGILAFKAALAALLGVLEATAAILGPIDELVRDNETVLRDIVGPLVAATLAYKAFSAIVSKTQKSWDSGKLGMARLQVNNLRTSMKSASTVAAGFRRTTVGIVGALGGPWGIALAGAATAIGIFAAKHAEARAKVEELRDSLDSETSAITKNTRATVAKRLEDEGVLEAAQKVGLSLDTITDAALGQADAMHQVAEGYIANFNAASGMDDQAREIASHTEKDWEKIKGALIGARSDLGEATASQERLSAAVNVTSKAGGHFARQQTEVGRSVDRSEVSLNRFSRATRDSAGTLDTQAGAAERATRAIKGLRDEVIKGVNAQIDFQDSADNLRKTIKDLTPEEIKSGHALDIHYEAGREVYRNMIDLATASGKVKGGMSKAREQIINTAMALGDSKKDAEELADQFFDLKQKVDAIPQFKGIKVDANVTPAENALLGLRSRLIDLGNTTITPHIHLPGSVHRAGGGAVYGPGTSTSDSISARLSDGEHVFTAEEVDDAGGQANVYAIRAALRRGGLPALADLAGGHGGALVDQLSIAVGDRRDLPEALDETMFHLRRISRGGRYND